MLSHEPMFLEANSPYINIHGHLHQNKMAGENYINVSAEHLNYTPALLDDILKPYNIDQKELDALIDL
jgi:calcineurin-like phosphoesterase family protein